jgi:hypothetical protein
MIGGHQGRNALRPPGVAGLGVLSRLGCRPVVAPWDLHDLVRRQQARQRPRPVRAFSHRSHLNTVGQKLPSPTITAERPGRLN